MTAVVVFKACVEAMRKGTLMERVSATDEQFHFQNWFKARLQKTKLHFLTQGSARSEPSAPHRNAWRDRLARTVLGC